MKEITLKEFEKLYPDTTSDWNFKLFKIVCVKCGSQNCEYNGKTEVDYGYYGSVDVTAKIIVKCHDCGNAFGMKFTDGGSGEYCNCDAG